MNLGYNISRIRENARLKQQYVARKSNLSVRTYQRIEAGQSPLTEERIQKISSVLNTTPDAIRSFEKFLASDNTLRGHHDGLAAYHAVEWGMVADPRDLLIQSLQAQVLLLEEKVKRLEGTFVPGL